MTKHGFRCQCGLFSKVLFIVSLRQSFWSVYNHIYSSVCACTEPSRLFSEWIFVKHGEKISHIQYLVVIFFVNSSVCGSLILNNKYTFFLHFSCLLLIAMKISKIFSYFVFKFQIFKFLTSVLFITLFFVTRLFYSSKNICYSIPLCP